MPLSTEQQALVEKYLNAEQLQALAQQRLQQFATELVQWSWNAANAAALNDPDGQQQAEQAMTELTIAIQTQEQELATLAAPAAE